MACVVKVIHVYQLRSPQHPDQNSNHPKCFWAFQNGFRDIRFKFTHEIEIIEMEAQDVEESLSGAHLEQQLW